MKIKKQILFILLIINSLPIYSQSVRIYRDNEPVFDSIVYRNTTNRLNFELTDVKGQKIPTIKSFQVKCDSGTIIPSNQAFKYCLFLGTAPFSTLNVFWEGKLIQKIRLKVKEVPLPQVYLTADMKNNNPLDLNKPIYPNTILRIIIQAEPHYKLTCPKEANYRLHNVRLLHLRFGKIIKHLDTWAELIDLKQFALRSGDSFGIEISSISHYDPCPSHIDLKKGLA